MVVVQILLTFIYKLLMAYTRLKSLDSRETTYCKCSRFIRTGYSYNNVHEEYFSVICFFGKLLSKISDGNIRIFVFANCIIIIFILFFWENCFRKQLLPICSNGKNRKEIRENFFFHVFLTVV